MNRHISLKMLIPYLCRMLPTFSIIIPSRFASTRFPGKPLADIGGKSMIQRVWDAAISVKEASHVIVATDDEKIFTHVGSFGNVVNTDSSHPSGTDRCQEAYRKSNMLSEVIVNLQGDEPFIKPEQIMALVMMFQDPKVQIATLKKEIFDAEEIDNPNIVKVVTDKNNRALYFSRSRIPYMRGIDENMQYYRHIGMYAYRANILEEICQLAPSALENTEKLEQLRWLENGFHIAVAETHWQSPAVDTPEDLEKAIAFFHSL